MIEVTQPGFTLVWCLAWWPSSVRLSWLYRVSYLRPLSLYKLVSSETWYCKGFCKRRPGHGSKVASGGFCWLQGLDTESYTTLYKQKSEFNSFWGVFPVILIRLHPYWGLRTLRGLELDNQSHSNETVMLNNAISKLKRLKLSHTADEGLKTRCSLVFLGYKVLLVFQSCPTTRSACATVIPTSQKWSLFNLKPQMKH